MQIFSIQIDGERLWDNLMNIYANQSTVPLVRNNPPERCRKLHEEWFAKLSCPLLRVDSSKPVDELLKQINTACEE